MAAQRITGRGAHPYALRYVLQNPIARMLPLSREQAMVYRLGERLPPSGSLDGHGPTWECVTMILAAQATQNVRVNLQRDYTLLSLAVSSSSVVSGGFRAQLYDVKKQRRLMDRGINEALLGGQCGPVSPSNPFFLREPYEFPDADSQILVMMQNLEAVTNTVQLVLYGVALRFNEAIATKNEFPGGSVSSTPFVHTGGRP